MSACTEKPNQTKKKHTEGLKGETKMEKEKEEVSGEIHKCLVVGLAKKLTTRN